MADFTKALEVVLDHEGWGSYTTHPLDKGGPTRWGITLSTLAAWRGQPVDPADVEALTREEATAIYRAEYWAPMHGDEVTDQVVATKNFDAAVNMGTGTASRLVQIACHWCGRSVYLDGVFGPITLAALNRCDPEEFIHQMSESMRMHYRGIVARDPSQRVFLKGWLARASWGDDLGPGVA